MFTRYTAADVAESRARLLELLPPGTTVYTVIRSVAKSGMSRRIDLYVIHDGRLQYLTGHVARVLGYGWHMDKQGINVNGTGMDMGFSVVYDLSRTLFPDGNPSTVSADGARQDGGYVLKQEWI